jgi:hypothetical protein
LSLSLRFFPPKPCIHISSPPCVLSVTRPNFTVRICYHLVQPPSCRTTPCRPSATAYSIYSQPRSVSGGLSSIRYLRTVMLWWQGPTHRGVFCVGTFTWSLFGMW